MRRSWDLEKKILAGRCPLLGRCNGLYTLEQIGGRRAGGGEGLHYKAPP